jgi:septum site-determining protein MinD
LAVDLLGVVPDDDQIILTTDRGTPAVLNEKLAVRKAYINIAYRILGQNVPLMNFQESGFRGFWSRLFGR